MDADLVKTKTVTALIRCVKTGEERLFVSELEEEFLESHQWWWQEGNAACDCNRRTFFVRAKTGTRFFGDGCEQAALRQMAADEGRQFIEEDDSPCGDGTFYVPWVEWDGVRYPVDDIDDAGRVDG